MTFEFTPRLRQHIIAAGRHGIIVEIAQSDSSDFEVTELHIHFVTEKQAAGFVQRRGFHPVRTDCCTVYLPNYRLTYADSVTFDLRSIGPFHTVRCEGISL